MGHTIARGNYKHIYTTGLVVGIWIDLYDVLLRFSFPLLSTKKVRVETRGTLLIGGKAWSKKYFPRRTLLALRESGSNLLPGEYPIKNGTSWYVVCWEEAPYGIVSMFSEERSN